MEEDDDGIANPYIVDELDKKRKKTYEVKVKNFDKKLEQRPRSYSNENMFETFTKDLLR